MHYTKERGIYYLNVNGAKTRIGPEVAIGFMYDKSEDKFTLLSHGTPESVRQWHSVATNRFIHLSMGNLASSIKVIGSKDLHPIHVNRVLSNHPYLKTLLHYVNISV